MKNYYQILGIPTTATEDQIKNAYKVLAVQLHPDKHMGDKGMEERFKEVNEAHQILSDSYKRAQFDLELHYKNFPSSQSQKTSHTPPPYEYKYSPRYNYPDVRRSYKGNFKSTTYAFGITLLIALATMGVMGIHRAYLQDEYEKLLIERRILFDEAQELYSNNQMKESLVLIADLAPFKTGEEDMQAFRSRKLEEFIFKGEAFYTAEDFEQAIRYYELVNQFSPYRPKAMKAHLAMSYRFVDKPYESLRLFAELIKDNYQVISTLVQIAEVYREELDDNYSSRNYLELARDAAIKQYRNRFGKAYSVVITSDFIPYDHYYLFEDLANIYNTMGDPASSIGTTNWMKRVWPDSASSYFIAGKSHELNKNNVQACGQYQLAIFLGHPYALPLTCK